jgi:hypothetical protein
MQKPSPGPSPRQVRTRTHPSRKPAPTEPVAEQWRPIPYFEDVYEISSLGRVKRVAPEPKARAGKLLTIWTTNGRRVVGLHRGGRQITVCLQEVFPGNEALIGYVRPAVGYSLTGLAREQCLFLLHGSGSNGKGVMLMTLRTLFGDYAQRAKPEVFVEQDRPLGFTPGPALNDSDKIDRE